MKTHHSSKPKNNHWNITIPLPSPKRKKFDPKCPPSEPELDDEEIEFIKKEGVRCRQLTPIRFANISDLDFADSFLSYAKSAPITPNRFYSNQRSIRDSPKTSEKSPSKSKIPSNK